MSDSLQPHELKHTRHPCLFTISWSFLKFIFNESVMLSNHLILCCHLLLLPSIFPSISLLQRVGSLWSKYWSFSFSISPPNEYSGLISFRIHWLISLLSKGLPRVFYTLVQMHEIYGAHPSSWSNFYIHTWLLEKP